jgi:hypothetical protein
LLLDILNALQGGEDAADAIDQIASDAPVVVIFDEALQPAMPYSAYPHIE